MGIDRVRRAWRPAAVAVLAMAAVACGRGAPAGATRQVRVAAASDLRVVLPQVADAVHRQHPDVELTMTYGSSGAFYAQLVNRAPFDLFLSADRLYPQKLEEQSLAKPGSLFTYGFGHLVVWVPSRSTIDVATLGISAVTRPGVERVAMANPATAPYGRAAEAALRHAGVYDAVRPRLVFGDTIAQTLQFAESGAADVALVSASLVRTRTGEAAGRAWDVPADWHPPIEQAGVILQWAVDPAAAGMVRAFLLGPEGRALLARHGFALPGA